MMKQHGSGPSDPTLAGQTQSDPTRSTRSDTADVDWIGVTGSRREVGRSDPLHVIGSAHGPRILELLRAS